MKKVPRPNPADSRVIKPEASSGLQKTVRYLILALGISLAGCGTSGKSSPDGGIPEDYGSFNLDKPAGCAFNQTSYRDALECLLAQKQKVANYPLYPDCAEAEEANTRLTKEFGSSHPDCFKWETDCEPLGDGGSSLPPMRSCKD